MSFKCVEKMSNVKDKISGKYVVKDCQLMQSISTCCMSFSQLTHSLNQLSNKYHRAHVLCFAYYGRHRYSDCAL